MPRLSILQNDYGPHGFAAISINLNEDMMNVVRVYARQNSHLFLRDPGTVWSVYAQNNYIPLNYVLDTAGVIRYWEEGFDEAALVSVIRQYLPDPIDHDVGVLRVIAPSGTFDSGAVAVPACSVYNYGDRVENYPVRLQIGSRYDTTVLVTNHLPATGRRVEFPAWTALERGQLTVAATAELVGDDIGSNNTATGLTIVNVRDFALTAIFAPQDTVDSGTTVVPLVEVRNLGTVADMGRVRLTIGSDYVDSVNVPLQPGRWDTVALRTWTAGATGVLPLRCTLITRLADMNPANNLLERTVVVLGLGVAEESKTMLEPFRLEPATNPAAGHVLFAITLPNPQYVEATLFAANGTLIRRLWSGPLPAGQHKLRWDCRDEAGNRVVPGRYFCCAVVGDRTRNTGVTTTR